MVQEKVNRVSANAEYKNRVKAIKDKLPSNWRDIIIRNFPKYGSQKAYVLMSNVLAGRSADVTLTEYMEAIVDNKLTLKKTE